MKNVFVRIIGWVSVVLIIALIFLLNPDIFSQFGRIRRISFTDVVLFSLLFFIAQLLSGLEIRVLCKALNIHLKPMEWFGLVSIRSMANYLPMSAGAIANGVFLKSQKGLPLTKYAAVITVSIIFMFLISGITGCAIISLFLIQSRVFSIGLIFVFGAIFLGSLAVIFIPIPRIKPNNRIKKWICSFHEGWEVLKGDRTVAVSLVFIKLSLLLVLVIRFQIVLKALGYTFDLGATLLIVLGATALRIGSIIPGNLGLQEGIIGWLTHSTGFAFDYGFAAASVDRLIQTIWIFIFGVFYLFYFNRIVYRELSEKS